MKKITSLRPHRKDNRPLVELDESKIYFYGAFEDVWISKVDGKGNLMYEYKTWQYDTFDPKYAIELVEQGYARWNEFPVQVLADDRVRYNIDMLTIY